MDLTQLSYFLAVADHGGFSRAARVLEIAQPSLSEQVKKLERSLGRTLFDRLPRAVVLTDAGRVLAQHARRLLADAETARRDVTEAGGRIAGTLRIGAIPTIAPFLLPNVMRRFADLHPDVRPTILEDVTTRLLTSVEEGVIDLAIISAATAPPTVAMEILGTEALVAALPREHPLCATRLLRPAHFEGHCVLVLKEMHCLAHQVADLCPLQSASGVVLQGEQLFTIAAMIEAGMGVSVVPAMMARATRRPGIVYRPFAGPRVDRPVCVATSLLRHRSNAARAFVDIVRPACAALCESK
ncbi:MAG TPA: LysR family transcriptional regulator [Tepidisphaeraceae bacterium]|jgi:LysR family hydrogen peroxide-inducible transcriptional activator